MFAVAPIKKGEAAVIWGLPKTYENREDAERAAANGRAKGKSVSLGNLTKIFSPLKKEATIQHTS